jgi:hypothetical protein
MRANLKLGDGRMTKNQTGDTTDDEVKLVQTSIYLHPGEINALDILMVQRRQATGQSVRRNQLIREAIQEYLKRQQQSNK